MKQWLFTLQCLMMVMAIGLNTAVGQAAGRKADIPLEQIKLPPDTLHKAPQKNLHFGFPYCHAGDLPDPHFGNKRRCDEFSRPVLKLGPHVAPLGMKFYTGKMFPPTYRHQIFIAEHGSWNRSVPIGYRITLAVFEKGQPPRYETFAEGWLQGEKAWGRPVDIVEMNDGSLLVSDDKAGVIYRISYQP